MREFLLAGGFILVGFIIGFYLYIWVDLYNESGFILLKKFYHNIMKVHRPISPEADVTLNGKYYVSTCKYCGKRIYCTRDVPGYPLERTDWFSPDDSNHFL